MQDNVRAQLFKNIVMNTRDVIITTDLKGIITFWNPASQDLFGWSDKEVLNTSVVKLLFKKKSAHTNEEFIQHLHKGAQWSGEVFVQTKTSREFPARLILTPLSVENGKIDGVLISVHKIKEGEEQTLPENTEMYRNLLESMPDIVMRFDRECRHLFVSKNVSQIGPMEAEDFIGKTHRELGFPGEQAQFWEQAIRSVFESSKPFETEFSIDGVNGHIVFNWRLVPEFDSHGNIIAVLSMSRDITQLRKAEQDYQSLFKEMIDGFALHEILCDRDGKPIDYRFLDLNPAFQRLTGLTRDIIGKTALEVMPHIESFWIETYGKVALTGEPVTFENYTRELGKYFKVIAYCPVPGQFACIFIDITERKRITGELAKESLMRKVLLDNIPGCYAMVLKNGTREIVASNETAKKMGAVPGETCYHICVQRDEPCPFCRAEVLWDSHLPQRLEVEYQGRWYDEQWIYVSEELFVHYIVDITSRKKAEMNLLNTQRLEALGILAGGIAHDFNNLLGGIFGCIEIAKELTMEPGVVKRLDKAANTIDRARGLTRQLLTFAKGGSPVRKIESFMPFLKEIALFALSGSPVTCHFNIQEDLWLAEFDKNQIGQVVNNLIINAQQAMPHGGEITLSAKNIILYKDEYPDLEPGPYIKISVKDGGTGVPKDSLVHIFDPFYTTKVKGHGLGLAICYSIIHRHGGSIEVESEPDRGSQFFFYLPALPDSQMIPVSLKSSTHQGSGSVLVMDDEEAMLESIEFTLSFLGYTVLTAENGDDLIQRFKEARRDREDIKGIIVDLTIAGGMGGKEVIRQIRKLDKNIPVLVMSGYADNPIMADPEAYGFTDSIQKPFRRVELVKKLNMYFL